MKILYTLTGRASDQIVKRLALNVRTTLSAAIYQKSLRLSAHGLQKYSKGYILNLANVDTESVSKAVDIAHLTWGIPLQLITVIVLLNRILGVSVWAGVGALTVGVIMLVSIVPIFMAKSAPMVLRIGDRRIKMIKEILDGIKLIKIRGWESLFLARVEAVRSEQLRYLKMFDIGIALFVMVGQFSNILMPIAALSLFGDESGGVTAAKIFPALSFFGFLVDPLLSLPQTLSLFNLATASWGRIYQFLSAKEVAAPSDVAHAVYTDPIRIIDGSFAWPEKVQAGPPRGPPPKKAAPKSEPKVTNPEKPLAPKTHLNDVNISIKQGSLTAIVGSVGSGKSSLMSAILGEMQVVSGKIFCNGSVAYCPQQPWIQSNSVQDNILFGKPMDVHQLEFALNAASFRADLDRLPNGIASEIAENGANLSGGQKARLSLARAVYADADIYVLDDVLAALDPRVSRLVFQKCILEALHGKTRLFVTHQLQYLNQVDHIIVVSQGTVIEQGSYAELFAKDGEFKRLVSHLETSPSQKAKLGKTPSQQAKQKTEKKAEKKPQTKPNGGSIIAVEDSGSITLHTWWSYIKAMGGVPILLLLALLICLFQGSIVVMNQWLSWWSRGKFQETVVFWIEVYDGIGAGSVFAVVSLNTCILIGVVRASRNFHSMAMSGLLSAPMWWFETQPTGRILNRFGKDVASIDQRLLPQLYALIASTGSCLSASVILGISAPIILGVIGGLMVVYAIVFVFYRRSIRELKRLEATERSPLQSQLSETLDGIPTIAAYKREGDFSGCANGLLDKSNKPIFLRNSAEIWVTIRMELLSSLIVLVVAMLGQTSVVSSSHLGVALSYSNAFTYILNLLIKSAANIESEMNSVDRLLEYTERLPQEHPAHLETDPVEGVWPSRGEIVFKDLEASYPSRPERPVLKNVNLKFVPGETVFIVGRTGSGKSTLLSILLRLLEIGKGRVEVDGEDISKLGVATLRRGMELIPQDPFIFSGTIRTALDFEGRFDDTKLWNALDLVGLKTTISNMSDKLDTTVSDNGSNFSVGQRQLLCLAGAILRDPKILLLDEATSSLDSGADVFLLKTVRANCPNATVMSVMHRLSDKLLEQCDKVLVMEEGTPAEFDSPQALLARPDSLFAKLMEATRQ
ncbi:P-loop containing nucleoside triphosphate hydrolase protein [Obba rivulosa]|uniref:P-loop containing nucleoside triphosphate hydrolase protein n=1 Tax=Obba rivulosa TaxID=1052685 RepID=A0A8E2DQQ4_9APHY|nr:P-loop containing nucleoside triphosphate hydrolase protein [Obba rivulosa]